MGLSEDFGKLKKLADQLGKDFKNLNLKPIEEDAGAVKELLSAWQTELNEVKAVSNDISSYFSEMVGSIAETNKGINSAKKSFSSLSDIAYQVSQHQLTQNKLSKEELSNLSQRLAKESQNLDKNLHLLNINKKTLEERKRILQAKKKESDQIKEIDEKLKEINNSIKVSKSVLDGTNDAYADLLINIENIKGEQELFEEKLGISTHLVEGLASGFEKLGFGGLSKKLGLDEATAKMKKIAQHQAEQQLHEEEIANLNKKGLSASQLRAGFGGKELKEKQLLLDKHKEEGNLMGANNGKLSVFTAGLKSMGASFVKNILDPTFLIGQLTDALVATDKQTGEMAKSMNLTYSEALNVRRELGNIGALSMDTAVNTKGLQESYTAIGKSLGTNAMASKETLITFTKLREQAGYTNEQLTELTKLSEVNGKSLEDNTKEILGGAKAYASQKGLVLNEKEILNDVVKASASLKLSLGGSSDALAKAAVQTKAVGLNLEQAAAMSESLLNFESSIENELSAELLLGKDLNFEKARQLALNNDIAGAAEEIANQVGTSADFAKMNAIQQESIAKAAGLTKDQLAQSLMDREALAKLSGVEGKNAQEKFNNLVKEVGLEEAKKQLGDEQLANQYAQQSVQERFAQATEKIQELFIQIAEPIMSIVSPLMDLVSFVLPAINFLLQPLIVGFQTIAGWVVSFIEGLKEGSPLAIGLAAALGLVALPLITSAIGAIFSTFAMIPFGIGIPLAIASVIGLMSMISSGQSKAKKGNDILSPGGSGGGYGKRTLFGPEGAIQLNDKDTVIAGTNLFDKADDMMSGPMVVSNSTAPKKEIKTDPNSGMYSKMDALLEATKTRGLTTMQIQ